MAVEYARVTLVSDSEVAIAQFLKGQGQDCPRSPAVGLAWASGAPCLFRPHGEGSVGPIWFPARRPDVPAPGGVWGQLPLG